MVNPSATRTPLPDEPVAMGFTAPLISIVVPVYKRAEWLLKNMEALEQQSYKGQFDVVIVDDGSPNKDEIRSVVDCLKESSHLGIHFFRQVNGGPAAARNYGVGKSRGTIICFLDDDSVPESSWLENIIKPFIANPRIGLVSGRTRSYYRDEVLPLLLEKTVYSGRCWATCNIAYLREAFDKVGGFDESYPEPSWEDNDLGLRVKWAGYLHDHVEQAVVLHPHERTLDEYRQKCLLNGRGMAVFTKKYWFDHPLWGVGGPFVMARQLFWGFHPSVWSGQVETPAYLRFTWSWYSLKGFCKGLFA